MKLLPFVGNPQPSFPVAVFALGLLASQFALLAVIFETVRHRGMLRTERIAVIESVRRPALWGLPLSPLPWSVFRQRLVAIAVLFSPDRVHQPFRSARSAGARQCAAMLR